jgi:TetR/AcrR family transcriptional repressor of uid operon
MIEDPEQRLVTAFLAFTRSLRTHDLIRRLIVTDPDSMLPLLTTHGSPIIAIGRHYIASQARRAAADGAQLTAAPEHIAELLARIAHSLVLTPESALPVDDETALAALAHATLARLAITRDS